VFIVIAFFGYRRNWQWTGLAKDSGDDGERRNVTLWAWISVLLVPLTLAAAGVLFTGAQHRSSSEIQQQQREDDLAVQESRAQDERLREYIDKLGTLLVEGDLDTKGYGEKESDVARARTLTLLYSADPLHKRTALQFLYEADLITEGKHIVPLGHVDLTGADLSHLNLKGAHMEAVFLQHANLNNALLVDTNLTNSNLGSGRGTGETQGATLDNANLSNAVLKGTDLYYSNFRNANLTGADLTHNDGTQTKLEAADLEGSLLEDTNLRGVDLREVRNLTQEQIDQAKGDENTQLPDGLYRPASWE
jgi:hypothetical protein